jgi:penicillin-binding protein 1A
MSSESAGPPATETIVTLTRDEDDAPAPGSGWRWFKRLVKAGLLLTALGLLLVGGIIWYYARQLPSEAELARYESPLSTRVLSGDGSPLTEFARERRAFVPFDQLPPLLVQAFLSAEDKTFFEHGGVDFPGLAGAVVDNFRNRGTGKRARGASTITQQVAKNMVVGGERSVTRKIKEMIVARRIERVFSKERILELYLNQIFLGKNSYGVAAASLSYFNKSLNELTLPEMAYLAALPKGPANYDPVRKKARALERRNYVLRRMLEDGKISESDERAAMAADLVVVQAKAETKDYNGDYFLEEVRREIGRKFGEKELYEGGLTVRSTIDSRLQGIAEDVMRDALLRLDRRGWRGPVTQISLEGNWRKRLADEKVPVGYSSWRGAVITSRIDGGFRIGFGEGDDGIMPGWAMSGRGGSLKPGDVIVVSKAGPPNFYGLKQVPEISGALVALDPHTGRILAMVGGFDSRKSQFNRATQAMRQPGSAFKPFVYATALENGFTPSSIIVDDDFCIDQGNRQGIKCFRNFSKGRTYGPQTLRTGVELSRNLMTVRLADRVGMRKVAAFSDKLDITQKMLPVLAMSLGAGETTVAKITAAYGMLANNGKRIEPTVIDRVQDRRGKTIYSHDKRVCGDCNQTDWTGLPMPGLADTREQVMSAHTAYQITHILEGVVQRGTGKIVSSLDRPLAGKTGTTNEATNVWFVGMSPDLVVGLYIGYDKPRSMGGAQGGTIAAPIFRNFMEKALKDTPKIPFRLPDGIRLVRVDARSGKLAVGDSGEHVIFEAFKPGTEPLRPSQRGSIPVVNDARNDAEFAADTGGIY